MITITQEKIAGLTPRWAPFPGFSLLFDNPGTPFREDGAIETLACDVDSDHGLEFYRRVARGLRSLDPDHLLQAYGLCPLPSTSYHVTVYDVANVADLSRCHPSTRDGLSAMLERLPAPEAFDEDLLAHAGEFSHNDWDLTFGFDELAHWGNGLAVWLRPRDEAAFERFSAARADLSRSYRSEHGIGAGEKYTPHLTLGYFMNSEGAERARPHVPGWNEKMARAMNDVFLTFSTASLYGFTDMATFFRKA